MNNKNRSSSKSRIDNRPISLNDACLIYNCSPPPLTVDSRVVWLSDNGPEYGYIKWLGKLPDVSDDWMAGVYFDNPVGSGTGLYNDYQLFEAPMNHASLVPIIGLLKAEDFEDANSNSGNAGGEEIPVKPIRTKRMKKKVGSGGVEEDEKCINDNDLRSSFSNNLLEVSALNSNFNTPSQREKRDVSIEKPFIGKQAYSLSAKPALPLIEYQINSNQKQLIPIDNSKSQDNEMNGNNKEKMEVGSLVEVMIDEIPRYGVIKWIGTLPCLDEKSQVVAGIELEDEYHFCNDGSWDGKKYFDCAPKKGYFVRLSLCAKDRRFTSSAETKAVISKRSTNDYSRITCDIPPLSTLEDLKYLCGKERGIQGHHNSCYLDATLFAMFSCTTIFESLLHRPPGSNDIPEYSEVQRVLKEEIVNPMRANLYVGADEVMHLRTLLEKLSKVRGLTSEEKDPEEFLNLLLNEILKAEPYLKLSSGLESFFYQLFVEKDEKLILPTVQQLFDQSFLASNFKLREIPSCLLIQMPRFGRQFKMYNRIIPSLYLDITDVLENSPRQCTVCGELAEYECRECFNQFGEGEGLDHTAMCQKCLDKSHSHKKRSKHKTTKLLIPPEFNMLKDHTSVQRIYMELFAILCIETSHYVCFVKCGSGPDAPWCFFDSMADRKGEQDGYNIPEVVSFPNLRWWLSDEGISLLLTTKDDKSLPEMARRLICDAYMCMYQSPEMMIYR